MDIKKFLFRLMLLITCIVPFIFFSGCSNKPINVIFKEQGNKQGVNSKMIKAICKAESNHTVNVINVNKNLFAWMSLQTGPKYFDSAFTANLYMDTVLKPLEFLDRGLPFSKRRLTYDVGICQINSQHLAAYKIDNEDLLNPEVNIKISAKIYKYNVRRCKKTFKSTNSIRMCALSMYNTGRAHTKSKIGTRYAKKVLKIYNSL